MLLCIKANKTGGDTMNGRIIGFTKCGYGERYLIQVDTLPKFKNVGYNCFIPANGVNELTIVGLSLEHESFGGNDVDKNHGLFTGWVVLTDGTNDTHVFVRVNGNNKNIFKITG